MHEDVELVRDVEMAELEGAAQREDQWSVRRALAPKRTSLVFSADSRSRQALRWEGRHAASQWRIVVDVELEQVKERIGEGDAAILRRLGAIVKGQRLLRLVAKWERDVLQVSRFVCDVFARFSVVIH